MRVARKASGLVVGVVVVVVVAVTAVKMLASVTVVGADE